jgi:DNA repair photolyase
LVAKVLEMFLFLSIILKMDVPLPPLPRKGRGALGNRAGRYELHTREQVDDGWWREDELPPLATTVTDEVCRSVISRNTSPDVAFDRSINPYRGCEHGCVYCFARPTHAYLGLSPGLDFETKLFAKPDAPRRLAEELRKPGYRPRPIMLGANTDPYQPVERKRQLTRGILEVLAEFRHPVAIATKSALVVRDLDILAAMAEQRLVSVGVSITSLEPALARVMEPHASAPGKRLAAMRALSEAGVPVAVMTAPLIPFVNDHELERILEQAAAHGARGANYVLLRLPLELKELFTEWLEAHFPDRAARVVGRLRDCRDGQLYVADWGTRMSGSGEYARLLAQRFAIACRRLGLVRGSAAAHALDCSRFRPPPKVGEQLTLL